MSVLTANSERVEIKIGLTFDDILGAIAQFSREQKVLLFEKIRKEVFKAKMEKLASEIASPGFSEDEIMAEIHAQRTQ